MNEYKKKNTEEHRIEECNRILSKHNDRVPIIVLKDKSCELADIDKQKYLVPKDMNLGQFIYIIRKRIRLSPEKALFILIDNQLMTPNNPLQDIYDKHKDTDGFLYITYSSENTFG